MMKTIQLKSGKKLLSWPSPIVMGVINVTDDSFYSKSRVSKLSLIVDTALEMIDQGAHIIDIGAASSRPGASPPELMIETERIRKAVSLCIRAIPDMIISVDTYRHEVAQAGIDEGALIINDISSGQLDPLMFDTISQNQVAYIAMHMKGTPETMQNNPSYDNILFEINQFFLNLDEKLKAKNIYDWVVDPGFGFGKSIAHNYELLFHLYTLKMIDRPVLVGLSRKSMIYKVLDKSPEDVLAGTTALHWEALIQGADILRVHDVKEAVQLIKLFKKTASWRQYKSGFIQPFQE